MNNTNSSWDALNKAVSDARELISNNAPNARIAAEGEAYIARVLAAGLSGSVLGHLMVQDGLSRALPTGGGPNPDYQMLHTVIDPTQSYQLKGQLNGSERVGVGLYRPRPEGGAPIEVGYAAFGAGGESTDGEFTLTLSANAEGTGTLKIPPDARILLIRILHRDDTRPSAQLKLRGSPAAKGLALLGGSTENALNFAASSLSTNIQQYLLWTNAVQSHPNSFAPPPPELEGAQGDPDTQYYLGNFDLNENEYLEVTMPTSVSGYWSLHAYNHWFECLQTPGVHDLNAQADKNGVIRIAIGANTPPDSANRIDTLGRFKGALICRIVGEGGCPSALVRSI